ncbi:pro-resilin-like [Macrobrachium nipponense]|uniref:pro-resilin-like n=1 Tax=Macrobrachium nipponense TaxID=159736 RepID=UPI0030C8B059
MNIKIPVLLCLVAMVSSEKRRMYSYKTRQTLKKMLPDQSHPAKHDFEWQVNYSNGHSKFARHETRDDQGTKGSYSVMLPDGRTQTVTYYVDQVSGYVATVTYDGQATYPEYAQPIGDSEENDSEEEEEEEEGRRRRGR